MSDSAIWPSFICADCDWFVLEPGKRRSGVCMARWMPNVRYAPHAMFGAYGRVYPFDLACEDFAEKGTLPRHEPERCGR